MNATLICNPHAGRNNGDDSLDPAIRVLTSAGWSIEVKYTQGRGDATRFAREASESGRDAVLVAGGDGTINEAIQALAQTETPFGYLPYGTVNVWAREVGIPRDMAAAAQVIVDGRIERLDLGVAGDRYFLLMAGLGFDGEVMRRVRTLEHHKQRFGVLPYVAAGLSIAPLYRGADVELRYDGVIRRVQALLVVLGNTRHYGGRFRMTPNAVANDGWLDLCIVKGRGPVALVRQSLPLLLSGSVAYSDVELLRIKALTVRGEEPLPVQLDGELDGTTPVDFRVAPRALRAIVPRDFTSNLIA